MFDLPSPATLSRGPNVKAVHINRVFLSATCICLATACSETAFVDEPKEPNKLVCVEEADRAFVAEDYETAIRLHERILEKDAQNGLETYHLGYIYGQLGNHSKEIFYYRKAIELGFEEERIFLNLGMAYGELGQMEDAIRAFRKDLVSNPNSAEVHLAMAMAYQKLSAVDLAEKECQEAIRLDPKNLDARFLLGRLYSGQGELEEAAQQLRRILTLDPTHEAARRYLEGIERRK
jgi:tetratricopeptide (TPR) repeat protein